MYIKYHSPPNVNKACNQFDDKDDIENLDLQIGVGDIIGVHDSPYQYVIVKFLGNGQYGSVYEAKNLVDGCNYAIKIMKSSKYFTKAAMNEINIYLKLHNSQNEEGLTNIVKFYSAFTFKGHVCIVLEKLSYSLFDVLSMRDHQGLPFHLIQTILKDITKALKVFNDVGLSHLDVKPENIMLASYHSSHVKLADVGAAQFNGKLKSDYVVTRYYRPPEIVLRCELTEKADIWSLGCLAVEMALGDRPLFNASNELELLHMIEDILGNSIPSDLIERSCVSQNFFEDDEKTLKPIEKYQCDATLEEIIKNVRPQPQYNETQMENEAKLKILFINLIRKMLEPDPSKRISLDEIMNDPFLIC